MISRLEPRFIVNETHHLMPPSYAVDAFRAVWVRSGRSGRDEADFRYRDRELAIVHQRLLLEDLKAHPGRYRALNPRRLPR